MWDYAILWQAKQVICDCFMTIGSRCIRKGIWLLSDRGFDFLAGHSGLKAVQITAPLDNRETDWMVSGGFWFSVRSRGSV